MLNLNSLLSLHVCVYDAVMSVVVFLLCLVAEQGTDMSTQHQRRSQTHTHKKENIIKFMKTNNMMKTCNRHRGLYKTVSVESSSLFWCSNVGASRRPEQWRHRVYQRLWACPFEKPEEEDPLYFIWTCVWKRLTRVLTINDTQNSSNFTYKTFQIDKVHIKIEISGLWWIWNIHAPSNRVLPPDRNVLQLRLYMIYFSPPDLYTTSSACGASINPCMYNRSDLWNPFYNHLSHVCVYWIRIQPNI